MFITQRNRPLADRYTVIQVAGTGATGEVRLVKDLATGGFRALKVADKKECEEIMAPEGGVLSEVDVLRQLDHPNIVRLYEFSETDTHYELVLDYCAGGELLKRVTQRKSLDEKTAANLMRQIFSAVAYCHKNGIVHRYISPLTQHSDLKLENIMFAYEKEDYPVKLIDFGTAVRMTPGRPLTQRFGTVLPMMLPSLSRNIWRPRS